MKLRFVLIAVFKILVVCSTTGCSSLPFQVHKEARQLNQQNRIRWQDLGEMPEAEARKRLLANVETVEEYTEAQRDPYTGNVSLPEVCWRSNLPRPIEIDSDQEIVHSTFLYSSESLIFGACGSRSRVKTQHNVLYCKKSRTLFVAALYLNESSLWPTAPLVSCR